MANEKRLIDANAFKMFLEDVRQDYLEEDTFNSDFAAEVIETVQDEYLANAPTVDAVEVVHGRWEWLGPNRLVPECMCGTCSACKVRSKYIVNTDICPNCGAKMDGSGHG